jgi:hypothetical protein
MSCFDETSPNCKIELKKGRLQPVKEDKPPETESLVLVQ